MPDAEPALAVLRENRGAVAQPVVVPVSDRQAVVRAHVFDRVRLPARLLHRRQHRRRTQARVGAREDVLVHEQAPDQIFGTQSTAQSSPLQVEQPVVSQKIGDVAVERLEALDADVFHHFEAGDLVVGARGSIAVVEAEHAGAVRDAPVLRPLVAELRLPLGNRHAGRVGAVRARGVARERSPAAADVEEPFAALQLQLLADEVHLVVLRLLQRLAGVQEERRRVDHAVAEEPAVEVVAAIVVLADDALVLLLRMDRHFRDEVGDEPLQMAARDRVLHELVAIVQQRVDVAGNIESAVEVRLVEHFHRDARAGVLPRQLLVLEHDVVGQLVHGRNGIFRSRFAEL